MDTALVGDIGGTNARLALATLDGDAPRIEGVRVFPTHEHGSLAEVVTAYFADSAQPRPKAACIAAAGPVTNGAVEMTNLRWRVAEDALEAAGFARAKVVNDFVAQAYGVGGLGPDDVLALGEDVTPQSDAPAAIIGAGTGFGAAALYRGDGLILALAGEGGHISFSPGNEEEGRIAAILAARFGHVSVERLLSGPGLLNIYRALGEIDGTDAPLDAPDAIARRASEGDRLATRAVTRFCSIYGAVAGDFALIYAAKGGVYLAGGLAPHLRDFLRQEGFRAAFEAKGRYRAYLRAIPTFIVSDTFLALKGAAIALRRPAGTRDRP